MSDAKRKWLEEHGIDRETCPLCGGTGKKPGPGDAVATPGTIQVKVGVKSPDAKTGKDK